MGRGKHRKLRHRDQRRAPDDRDGPGSQYTRSWAIARENADLERYYDALLGFDEPEREQFWAALRRDLPNSFRFCGSKGHALAVQKLLRRRYVPQITDVEFDGQPVPPPLPVSWYPDSLAWSMTTPKTVIRKFPPFAAFQRFLVSENNVGNISRQELVSMIPPLLLDVRPGMAVLDLCAAPGSKAAQLLEMLHAGEEARLRKVLLSIPGDGDGSSNGGESGAGARETEDDDGRATGILVANDMDYKRCHLLTHQLKRLSSPNLVVTQHDATLYPQLRIPNVAHPHIPCYLKFDRILADVPCSGDGTLRKNPEVWKNWSPGRPIGLHLTQVRILVRALQMLKVGGRVVYSTCSMNPVENEAVVAAAIDRCGGPDTIGIIDCEGQLPGLQRRPGLTSWPVMDRSGRIWTSWNEVQESTAQSSEGVMPSKLLESMFAKQQQETGGDAGAEKRPLGLERCMRLYAHLQDAGCFFVSVLEKKAEFRAKPEEASAQPEHTTTQTASVNGHKRGREGGDEEGAKVKDGEEGEEHRESKRQKPERDLFESTTAASQAPDQAREQDAAAAEELPQPEPQPQIPPPAQPAAQRQISPSRATRKRNADGPWEEPFKFLPADKPAVRDVIRFYAISPRFPTDRYMVRNALGEPSKTIYYTSALVRDLLVSNEGRSVRFVHAGVRMFVKQEAPSAEVCRWRIQSEGMPILHAYVGPERIVRLTKKETLRKLLVDMFYKITGGGWQGLGEIGERLRDMGMGCYVLRVEPEGKRVDKEANDGDEDEDEDEDFSERMILPLWKSFQSVNLMLPKEDRAAMLLRIFNDTTPLVNMTLKQARKEEESDASPEDTVAEGEDGKQDGQVGAGVNDAEEDAGKEEEAEELQLQNGGLKKEA